MASRIRPRLPSSCARRAIRWGDGDGWFLLARGARYDDPLDFCRQMAKEAGRDLHSLPLTFGGAPGDPDIFLMP